jgi:hypothetical protein
MRYTSTTTVPKVLAGQHRRFEIGDFFVTIYHANKRDVVDDQATVETAVVKLLAILGPTRPMFRNQWHPSLPATHQSAAHPGTSDEVHEDVEHKLAHYHVELIGAERDTAFSNEEIATIKSKLELKFGWS